MIRSIAIMLWCMLSLGSAPDVYEQACDSLHRVGCTRNVAACAPLLEYMAKKRADLDVGCIVLSRTAAEVRACGATWCKGRP